MTLVRFVVGPTGAGKTHAAVAIARKLEGVVVSADSRQVYRGLDAATGKMGEPTEVTLPGLGRVQARVLDEIPQLGMDFVEITTPFTAARWLAWAAPTVEHLLKAEVPVVVAGGTGLYVEALARGFVFPPEDLGLRAEIVAGLAAPEGPQRRAVRREELKRLQATPQARPPSWSFRMAFLDPPAPSLRATIDERVRGWFRHGSLADEVRALLSSGAPRTSGAFTAIGYAEALALREHRIDKDTAIRRTVARTWDYVRRQRTYFRQRFPEATTVRSVEEAVALLLPGARSPVKEGRRKAD